MQVSLEIMFLISVNLFVTYLFEVGCCLLLLFFVYLMWIVDVVADGKNVFSFIGKFDLTYQIKFKSDSNNHDSSPGFIIYEVNSEF